MIKDISQNNSRYDQPQEEGLIDFRQEIDAVDAEIVALLAKRMNIVSRVAAYKHIHDIAPILPKRIKHVREQAKQYGREKGLNPHYLHDLWTRIIDESCRVEQDFINHHKET